MKSSSLFLLALVGLITLSCSEKETPGGVKYTVLKKGDGLEVATGQFLVMDISLSDSKDSVWFSSKNIGYPAVVPALDSSMTKDTGEYGVFKVLTKGDCITFKLTAQTVFNTTRRRAVPKDIDPKSLFTFVVSLKDVWSDSQVQEFQIKMTRESQRKQVTADSITITNYLKENNLIALSTPSGLRYVIQKEGKGDLAITGKSTLVHYAGFTLDGKIFDTSMASVAKEKGFDNGGRNEPYPVVVNKSSVIAGWHEMLTHMNKGMKVTVFIPSYLGYGPQGNGPTIPPNTVLMFDMELANIK
jgi:FKBP-type peptidyl-prolyl cis-trans isomerase FkpA